MEKKVLKIFEKVGCPIEGNNIEACHRLSEKKKKKKRKHNSEIFLPKGLPKCTWREERVEKVGHMKKKNGFPEDNTYIWCTYYRVLWSKAKCLNSLKKISSFYVSWGAFKIKFSENSLLLPITHVNLPLPSESLWGIWS